MNFAQLLARSAARDREAPALALGTAVQASYGELAHRAAVLAGQLRGRYGLAPGERVALVMRNGPAVVELLFGCWHAGLAAVPVNAKLHPAEVRYILEQSGARLCFCTGKLATAIGPETEGLPGFVELIDIGEPAAPSAAYRRLFEGEPAELPAGDGHELAWLFYTSGTTGRPKGAMLTHRNLLAMSLGYFADVDSIAPRDAILHAAPMSHGSGLYILPHVIAGACQIVPESGQFDPAEVFALLGHHRGVSMFMAPTMVKRLVDHPEATEATAANLKTVIYGGGPMYVADLKRAMARLGNRFVQIYGEGESPMTITTLSKAEHADEAHPRYEARLASVGRAQAVVELRVADGEDRALPRGELGEVLLRGESVMPGYWDNPEASAETLRGGWLHTGDLGVLDEDGYLTLKDRSKDVIISGGANIYPREIEEILLGHPGVLECSVIGRPHPEWGEEVIAFVVARPDRTVEPGQLDALCLKRIARFKRPRVYRFVEALPKNNYGKVLKTELRELAKEPEPA
ncbi:MAG: AMP-binding protein [Kiloniellales bacterium]